MPFSNRQRNPEPAPKHVPEQPTLNRVRQLAKAMAPDPNLYCLESVCVPWLGVMSVLMAVAAAACNDATVVKGQAMGG